MRYISCTNSDNSVYPNQYIYFSDDLPEIDWTECTKPKKGREFAIVCGHANNRYKAFCDGVYALKNLDQYLNRDCISNIKHYADEFTFEGAL